MAFKVSGSGSGGPTPWHGGGPSTRSGRERKIARILSVPGLLEPLSTLYLAGALVEAVDPSVRILVLRVLRKLHTVCC